MHTNGALGRGSRIEVLSNVRSCVVRNNLRRVCVGIQRLQRPPDSGMMSACCSWRERSSQ